MGDDTRLARGWLNASQAWARYAMSAALVYLQVPPAPYSACSCKAFRCAVLARDTEIAVVANDAQPKVACIVLRSVPRATWRVAIVLSRSMD
jgi:hypothetical protein